MDTTVMRGRLAQARVATLATVDADGEPHLVPVCFASLPDGRIVSAVDHKPKTSPALRRLEHVRANPAVSLLAHHYDDDWDALWWVRVDGTAEVLDRVTDDLVGALAAKYAQYADRPPTGAALVVTVRRWRGWSARP